jgi:hypothetical protein
MRRTFKSPFGETRVDGSVHVHDGLRFYVLDGEELITGDSRGVTLDDSAREVSEPDRAARARRLFEGFEGRFMSLELHERDDPETLEKLRALGYVP